MISCTGFEKNLATVSLDSGKREQPERLESHQKEIGCLPMKRQHTSLQAERWGVDC